MVFPQDLGVDTGSEQFTDWLEPNSYANSCGRLAQLLQSRESVSKVGEFSDSAQIGIDVVPCAHCGSPARVGYGHCLSCILHQGLEYDNSENAERWDDVLEEVNIRRSEWRIGNYQILQEIGRGGMGVIYKARQRNSQRIVALKRILSVHADSRDTVAVFGREAVTGAGFGHPMVCPI